MPELRVDDNRIVPASHRLVCDLRKLSMDWAYAADDRGLLAYSSQERDAIAAALDNLKLPYTIEPVDQPNAAHLELLQGTVSSRSQALAALEALGKGETPDIRELRLKQLEADVADLKAAPKEASL